VGISGEKIATVVTGGVLAVLGAAAVYHVLLVLDVLGYGHRGRPPSGEFLVLWSVVAMVAAVVQMLVSLSNGGSADRRLVALVPLAAAAVVVTRYYSPDPYHLTGSHPLDIAEGGTIAASRVWVTVGFAAAVALSTVRWLRVGLALGALALVLCATAVASEGFNH
jgi:hypothetical protein